MEHAKEIDLIELVAGRLDAAREEAVRTHLRDCPACRTKLQDIQGTWDILGAWQVQPARPVDLAGPAVSPGPQDRQAAQLLLRRPGIRMAARIAAAIAVSALLGYAGGRWSIRPAPTRAGMEPPPYFSVLEFEVGDSLSSLVLPDGTAARQEG
jgi:anti-sigma factor RsiW